MKFYHLGQKPYREVLALQEKLRDKRQAGEGEDSIILVEHPRVITEGRRDASQDFLVNPEKLRAQGFDIEKIHRGGKLTYHGPGQLVVYFILKLSNYGLSVPQFVRRVEQCAITTLKHYGLEAKQREGCPGVWVQDKKIVSIGLSVNKGISMHGMALNINPKLEDFKVIISCGMPECKLTSIAQETGSAPGIQEAASFMEGVCEELFKA